MNICDLCSKPLTADHERFMAAHMRKAVELGLSPPHTMNELAAAMGMTRSAYVSSWRQRVMTDHTDWLLCRDCAAVTRRLLSSKKWWQFWKQYV